MEGYDEVPVEVPEYPPRLKKGGLIHSGASFVGANFELKPGPSGQFHFCSKP